MPAFFHQDRIALVSRQHACAVPHAPDDGGADEDGFHISGRCAGLEFRFRRDARDTAIDLPPVGVALDADIDEPQALLRGARNLVGQQDRAGAGSEDGPPPAELAQRLHQVLFTQQLEHGGALAAGNDQAVQVFEVGCAAHLHSRGPGSLGRLDVRVEISL